MSASRRAALIFLLGGVLVVVAWPRPEAVVRGRVEGPNGGIEGACVRWQGAKSSVLSDAAGRFRLPVTDRATARLTAFKEGFRIGHVQPSSNAVLTLLPLPAEDNPHYAWIPPDVEGERHHPGACVHCHQEIHREWAGSAHARAARNLNVLTFFDGYDSRGRHHEDWNLRREHPLGLGVCARCHAPTYSSTDLDYDLRRVKDVAARGVHCDLCHKIVDVPTDKLGERFGSDGLDLLRPKDGDQLFYGPLDDAVRPGESFGYFPVYQESRYCAACHEGVIFGVRVYGTYSEWLESPAKANGQQCQDCHMTPTGRMTNIAPGHGGIERDPKTLASHATPGATMEMLQRSIRCEATLTKKAEGWRIDVSFMAEGVGHRVPTGFIDRHLVLVVEAWDAEGRELRHFAGPTIGPLGGKAWQEKAGRVFGRWLIGTDGRTPLPFWLPHEREEDTRLHPGKEERYAFSFPTQLDRARVRVIYRRFWLDVAQPRSIPDNELTIVDRWLVAKMHATDIENEDRP